MSAERICVETMYYIIIVLGFSQNLENLDFGTQVCTCIHLLLSIVQFDQCSTLAGFPLLYSAAPKDTNEQESCKNTTQTG